MEPATALNIAHTAWPKFIRPTATAVPIEADRLADQPLWRIEAGEHRYALRGWRGSEIQRAVDATRFVTHAARAGRLRLPVPIESHRGPGTTLHPAGEWHWELARWLEGDSDFAARPSLSRLEAMCRQLAMLHQETVDLQTPESPSAVHRHLEALDSLGRGIDSGEYASLDSAALPVVAPGGMDWAAALRRGAQRARPELELLSGTPLARQWTWGDAWHNNFLLVGDEVSGLVDFATVRVDTLAADLARLLGSTTAEHRDWWDAGMAAYEAVCPLSKGEKRAVTALHASGTVLSLANWLRWLGVEKRRFSSPTAACDRMTHFVLRLTHLL